MYFNSANPILFQKNLDPRYLSDYQVTKIRSDNLKLFHTYRQKNHYYIRMHGTEPTT
jgi:hypothetical protein